MGCMLFEEEGGGEDVVRVCDDDERRRRTTTKRWWRVWKSGVFFSWGGGSPSRFFIIHQASNKIEKSGFSSSIIELIDNKVR